MTISRIMIAGGGTGGHLFSGVAVVEEFARRASLAAIYVGTKRGIESRVIPQRGEQLELISAGPINRVSAGRLMQSLAAAPQALAQSASILRRHRPDVVLGVGGYASGPLMLAASLAGYPTALIEQNTVVGLTNRMLRPFVERVYLPSDAMEHPFARNRVRVLGNPVRRDFVRTAREAMVDPAGFEARASILLVLGGSQGASFLNHVVPPVAAGVSRKFGVKIVHQTGASSVDSVRQAYHKEGVSADVVSFIDDLPTTLKSAKAVIARAGATTLAEVSAVGRPAIFVPYPHATDNHQLTNARALEQAGAAAVVTEGDSAPGALHEALLDLLLHPHKRLQMAERSRACGRPDAAAAVVDDLEAWVEERQAAKGAPSQAVFSGSNLQLPLL